MILFLWLFACTQSETSPSTSKKEVSRAPTPNQPMAARSMSMAMWKTTSIQTYQKKIDEMHKYHQKKLATKDERSLLLVLGSSSSGGGTRGNNMKFWPEILRERLKKHTRVHSLAQGGATTWHMKHLVQKIGIKADICILYMGFNDHQEKSPRQSIAELERGAEPQASGFVPWVYPEEQKENIQDMVPYCTKFLLVHEYSLQKERIPKGYQSVFSSVAGAKSYDPADIFRAQPTDSVMMDTIHPTPYGHTLLEEGIYEQIKEWLPN